jgi:hypothetical protein
VFEAFECSSQFAQRGFVFRGEFDKNAGVFDVTAKSVGLFCGGFDTASTAEDFLRALLVVPEVRFGGFFFYFGEFSAFGIGVKETSAAPPCEPPGRRIFVAVLRSLSILVEPGILLPVCLPSHG